LGGRKIEIVCELQEFDESWKQSDRAQLGATMSVWKRRRVER
jgi:Fe-S-cluster formation regulator IscX/YfhJ